MALWLELVVSAGTPVSEAAAEMIRVANLLQVKVKVQFNGVLLISNGSERPKEIVASYWQENELSEERDTITPPTSSAFPSE